MMPRINFLINIYFVQSRQYTLKHVQHSPLTRSDTQTSTMGRHVNVQTVGQESDIFFIVPSSTIFSRFPIIMYLPHNGFSKALDWSSRGHFIVLRICIAFRLQASEHQLRVPLLPWRRMLAIYSRLASFQSDSGRQVGGDCTYRQRLPQLRVWTLRCREVCCSEVGLVRSGLSSQLDWLYHGTIVHQQ